MYTEMEYIMALLIHYLNVNWGRLGIMARAQVTDHALKETVLIYRGVLYHCVILQIITMSMCFSRSISQDSKPYRG